MVKPDLPRIREMDALQLPQNGHDQRCPSDKASLWPQRFSPAACWQTHCAMDTVPVPADRTISARNAHVMDSMLRDVVRKGTARDAARRGRKDLAGKTGTSSDARDAWFAGYSSGLSSVVWIGYDQPRSLGA